MSNNSVRHAQETGECFTRLPVTVSSGFLGRCPTASTRIPCRGSAFARIGIPLVQCGLLLCAQLVAQVPDPLPQGGAIQAVSAPMVLLQRSPSGAPIPGAIALQAEFFAREARLLWRAALSTAALGAQSPNVRSCALMLWDPASLESPPTIIYLHPNEKQPASVSGRLVMPPRLGGPLNLNVALLEEPLGVSGLLLTHPETPVLEIGLPLALIQTLFPAGVLADARVLLQNGALLSTASAGSWYDAPDAARAAFVHLWSSGPAENQYGILLKSLAGLAGVASEPLAQSAAWTGHPLSLDPAPDSSQTAFEQANALRIAGDEPAALNILWQTQLSGSPISLGWQESLLELQTTFLQSGDAKQSIETGFDLIERDGLESGVVLRAVRMLAQAFSLAQIRLDSSLPDSTHLKERLLRSLADRSIKATYGADLLLLHNQVHDAISLLESVRANPFAPAAARAMALYRLAQINFNSGDWRHVLHLVEQIQDEAPAGLQIRGHSLALLDEISLQDPVHLSELTARRESMAAKFAEDTRKAARQRANVSGVSRTPAETAESRKEQ